MHRRFRLPILFIAALGLVVTAMPASAFHEDRPRTNNIHPMGHIEEPRSLFFGPDDVHTDIAFWGKHAFQGSWRGFNIRDISAPGNPKHVSHTVCTGPQGDVVVWDNILVRSWDGGAFTGAGPGHTCGGEPVPVGFAGFHIFDVSDVSQPVQVAAVQTCRGSHTHTLVTDPADPDHVYVYVSGAAMVRPAPLPPRRSRWPTPNRSATCGKVGPASCAGSFSNGSTAPPATGAGPVSRCLSTKSRTMPLPI
jgi:hypothetical protein